MNIAEFAFGQSRLPSAMIYEDTDPIVGNFWAFVTRKRKNRLSWKRISSGNFLRFRPQSFLLGGFHSPRSSQSAKFIRLSTFNEFTFHVFICLLIADMIEDVRRFGTYSFDVETNIQVLLMLISGPI